MNPGTVIVLNGTSSAGKSSIARVLQERMEVPYLHTGIDHFLSGLPPRCFESSDDIDPPTREFFLQKYANDRLTGVQIGPGALRLLAGMYHGVAALAAAGVHVIDDDVIYDRRVLAAAVDALRNVPVLFVGLHLPRKVAEQRERARGDRGPGGATAFYDRVHAHGIYDLELDTAADDPERCALRIKEVLEDGQTRHAFRDLAEALAPRI